MKFHVNPETGEAGRCTAQPGNCKLGAQTLHFKNKEAAMEAFEHSMEGEIFSNKKDLASKQKRIKEVENNPNLDLNPLESIELDEIPESLLVIRW